jgi:FG-GAP repeat
MAQIKTANFLPETFRTEANQKFLNATLDQLVTQPDLRNIHGYVGRKFAPTFKSTDNYQPEPNVFRQNYQLEPSVVVKNKITGDTEFFSSYIDLLQQVDHYGGLPSNQTRLFNSESYSYNGLFDFDKFVNFNQYYWLENGPQMVEVFASDIPIHRTYTVLRDPATGSYKFSTEPGIENPTLRLAYGGVYTFIVNQPGVPFWIQTDPGTSGTKSNRTKLSSRDVLGVVNNGIDVGTITFKVPQPTAQDFFVRMGLAGSADLSTELHYSQVQNQRLSSIIAAGENGFDGVNAINQLHLKSLIFINNDLDDSKWTVDSVTVPVANRRNAWQITLSDDADPIVTLNPLLQSFTIGALQKVFVRSGVTRAENTYYLASDYLSLNLFKVMPDITAPATTLYYQDGANSVLVGQINLLNASSSTIDVEKEILGATGYKSPNGVTLTNGLRIKFDDTAYPSKYQNNTYYVEGVGKSIRLVDETSLISPESFAVNGLVGQDYVTINRSSIDSNPWSRSNRWFHVDIINAAAAYNNVTPVLDQTLRASRPIIEFEADLQLFNYGRVAVAPIDLINFTVTDSRNLVELQPYGYTLDGVKLEQGMRVTFAVDFDPTVRDKIFVVNVVYIATLGTKVINLVPAQDYDIGANNNLVILDGPFRGLQYYYTGSSWVQGQQKNSINQSPLFDVIDSTGMSISTYTDSTFSGTKVFSYTQGSGQADKILGFPLSYRNFNQIGDIQFTNNFDTDTINYTDGNGDAQANVRVNELGWLKQNSSLTVSTIRNNWTTNVEKEKQFQVISGVYDGKNSYFKIDIDKDTEASIPYFRVYKNALQITGWEVITVGVLRYVHVIDPTLTTGDQIDILIYSSESVSQLGYYEVPKNLDYNSQNKSFDSLTLGQLRNHVSTMVANSNQVSGSFPGESNLRDLNIKAQSGSILQHASPVLYSALFLVDEHANFIKGLDLARREYSKVKNKIIELSTRTLNLDYTNIPGLLDTLLKNINAVKNKTFAWYYSDMVPYGDIKNTINYTVQSVEIVDYEISNIFNDKKLSNTATLVYLNNVQLVKGEDYTFDTNRAGVTITAPLTVGDVITINEYSDTDGNYIPETPSKMGLYPKFSPKKYYDTTYATPTYVIQGHDGSITPAFGDYRDDLLLEFEKRIYNNIKIDPAKIVLDIYDFLPGKFRNTEYSSREFNQLLTDSFLKWVGSNRIDYSSNTSFVASNEFSYNYNRFVDTIDGANLPGYWRAIFKYYFDTDRPHTHPWEMIGLTEQPTWWEKRYGSAPYTGGNMVLWDDMASGLVWNNGNSYVDQRFVRPGLQTIIPIDANGALLPPSQFIVKSFNSKDASADFRIGDQGPVETAWRRSSEFPFAFQQALALAKPGFYFGSLMNIGDYYKNTELNQYLLSDTLQRVSATDVVINGSTKNNVVSRAAGYLNWVAEYLRNQGIDPSVKLSSYLQNVSIQLAYKMAGFTDQSLIQVIAEQSSPTSTNNGVVIPNESYSIDLYKSTPVASVTYSAVIVERTGSGYTVSGYDTSAPYFTIIPSLANNNSFSIPVLQDTAVVYQDFQNYKITIPYGYEFTSRQQVVDFLVSYQRYLKGVGFKFTDIDPDLSVQRDWLLSVREYMTWAQQGWNTSSVIVLSPLLDHVTLVTASGVVDQIQNQPTESCILDTSYGFVKYSQMSVNRQSTVDGNTFTVKVSGGQTIGLVKLAIVEYEHVIVFDNKDIFNDVIYVPELGNRQYRLKLIGKKTGSWTGAMNPPGFIFNNKKVDAWQQGKDYLMGSLVRYKNNNYTALSDITASTTFNPSQWAQLSSSELKTGLLPNFSYNAEKFNRFNDIDNPESLGDFGKFSDSAIGFKPRQYLVNFGIDETTQAKFYQGYIRQKGTMNAINAFTATGVNGVTSDINVYEEWAMRVGEFGALDNNRSVDLILTEGTFNGDPVTLTLLSNTGVSDTNIIGVHPNQLYKTEGEYTPSIYTNRDASSNYKNDIQTAGYVNINDVAITAFDLGGNIASLSANIDTVGIGSTIWSAKDLTGNWNVFRVSETDVSVVKMTYSVDNVGVITTSRPHGMAYGDVIVVKSFDVRVNAFYRVYNVVDAYNFSVIFYGQAADQIKQANTISGTGALYKLNSVRVSSPTDLASLAPLHDWVDNDKLWVDSDTETGGWVVYNKSTPWTGNVSNTNPSMKLDANSYVSGASFGKVVTISSSGAFAAASSSTLNTGGNVYAFVANVTNGNVLTLVANIGKHSGGSSFGSSLDTAGNLLYIGNQGDGSTEYGRVHIHKFNGNASFPWVQTLTSPSASNVGDLFGASISASADGTWLYVSAPNKGNVYVYQANANSYYSYSNTISVGSSVAAQFGYKVKTTSTGNQVAISAPYQAVNGVSAAGTVYVFDRSIESFVANGTAYTTTYPISSNSLVTVNGNITASGFVIAGNTITFTNAPVVGSLINVETNRFKLLETLTSDTPTSGGAFGSTLWISGNDADVYVASPGYSAPGYYSGIVYRYVNQGASYGTITGTNYAPVITAGDSIRINGFSVQFTGGNVVTAAQNINSANIAGVTAIAQGYGALTITSNVTTPYQKLIIGPGTGNAMANLGLSVFASVQTLKHPGTEEVSQYGTQIISSADSSSLVISANGGSTENTTSFDLDTTTFDLSNVVFVDSIDGSGVVYVYGLVNSELSGGAQDQYVLVQKLQNHSVSANDQFGYSVAMNSSTLLVGAPGDSNSTNFDPVTGNIVTISNAGTFYTYNNFNGNVGWDVVRQESPKVDIDSVSRMYLYNANTSVISVNLDYIDPAKGKVLGAAQDDLDFITAYDPAIYNSVGGIDGTPNLGFSLDYHWGPEQATKTWWNTSVLRYLDYEQGSLTYRANNWGRLFPDSKVQVCEWVASNMPPSAYPGPGVALYADNSAYVVETTINPNTKLATSTYYYWVTGKTSIEPESVHRNTISTIQDIIENPQAQGIAYATVIRDDSVSLHGIGTHLSGNSVVLHLDYDTVRNTNVIHSEYQLVQEGNATNQIPTRIVDKILDSLSGVDANGLAVPNPSLSAQSKIGLGNTPNQTLFVNRTAALQNWVEYVNGILIQHPVVSEFNINSLYDSAPLPDYTSYDIQIATHAELAYIDTNGISEGYTVLVVTDETHQGLWVTYKWSGSAWAVLEIQSYYTPLYWSKIDWYDATYDSTVLPTYVVNTTADVAVLKLKVGDTVKVLNNGGGEFAVYRVESDLSTSVVGIQNGTIQLSSKLYTTTGATNEIRIIFNAIRNYIFTNTLSLYFNQMFFFLINYILTEQPSVDWIFKTSFISVLHKFRTLGQPASYSPDNQTYYETYINEVKPYRTSIREYKLDYQGNDEYFGDSTDFDIPSTFIDAYGAYRSPNGEDPRDGLWLSSLPQYSQWYNNHTYSIGDMFIANAGVGYTTTPTVTIVGGGGTGANVIAVVDFNTGKIAGFEVISPGKGYTSQPSVFINGTGSGALAYAKLVNHYQIDSLPTTQLDTFNNVTVYVGNVVTQQNTGAYGTVYSTSNGNVVTLVGTVGTFNTSDYIFSDAANLNSNVTSTSSFTQFVNNSYNTVRNLSTTIKFDRYTYSSNVITWAPNITVSNSSVVTYSGQAYQATANVYSTAILTLNGNVTVNVGDYITQVGTTANAEVIAFDSNSQVLTVGNLTSNFVRRGGNVAVNGTVSNRSLTVVNNVFDYTKYKLLDASVFTNAADRITAYYSPTSSMPGKELAQLMSGIEYPGVTVEGVEYAANTSVFNSNIIYTWSNTRAIYSSNLQIPTVTVNLSSSAVVYTGNVVTQAVTGATGVVYETSTGNLITLVDVVGSFSNVGGHYLSANTANLGVTVTGSSAFNQNTIQNLVNFTELGYSASQPITVINLDTSEEHQLLITEVDTWRIITSGNVPTTSLGANLSLKYYDYNNPTYLDTIFQNSYTNTDVSTVIDGGAYYDTFSSHAPEEFVPGVTYDNLNMTVTTGFNNNSSSKTYRVVQNMNGNAASTNTSLWPSYYGVSASHTTALAQDLHITDSNIYVQDASVLNIPNTARLIPGVVFINGEKIVFWGVDAANNALLNIRRAVDGTGAPLVHSAGTLVVDTNINNLIPGGNAVHTTTWLNQAPGAPQIIIDNTNQQVADNFGNVLSTTGSSIDAVTDGLGLEGSNTVQALFIKGLT